MRREPPFMTSRCTLIAQGTGLLKQHSTGARRGIASRGSGGFGALYEPTNTPAKQPTCFTKLAEDLFFH
jgi:hypothetical protein